MCGSAKNSSRSRTDNAGELLDEDDVLSAMARTYAQAPAFSAASNLPSRVRPRECASRLVLVIGSRAWRRLSGKGPAMMVHLRVWISMVSQWRAVRRS